MFYQYFKSQRNKYGAAHGSCNAARFAASFVADSCADIARRNGKTLRKARQTGCYSL